MAASLLSALPLSTLNQPLSHARLWAMFGALVIGFHLWLVFSGLLPNLISRPLHMALALPWIFIALPAQGIARIVGFILCAAGMLICAGIALTQNSLGDQYGYLNGPLQLTLAVVLIVVVLEMARRAIGWPLPLVAAITLLYGIVGHQLPGEYGFSAIPLNSFLGTLTIAEGGLWGKLTGISVNIVAIFVIFGAVLNGGEAGKGFMNIAASVGGRLRGGAAKISVISSALFGSISGSASANVASTGAVTLPAMTRLGYPRALAAATEAVASSGGQIMPPLMGAGAFVMVELTGIPYTSIMAAALLPAILYFFAVWIGIDAYNQRQTLSAVPAELLPDRRTVFITSLFFLVPFTTLLAALFVFKFTAPYSAVLAIFVAVPLLLFNDKPAIDLPAFLPKLQDVCINAGKQIATIAAIIICASIIVGVLGITGLGVKITSTILAGSGGNLWVALGLTAFACLLLGMEVPTTAAYVICVSVAGPALIELGLSPLQAHLFVFWFALISTITPPVCGAVFIAAAMVVENWLKVAITAMTLGIGLYLIPLAMIANPSLIQLQDNPVYALLAFIKTAVALAFISFGVIAKLGWLSKVLLTVTGLLILFGFGV